MSPIPRPNDSLAHPASPPPRARSAATPPSSSGLTSAGGIRRRRHWQQPLLPTDSSAASSKTLCRRARRRRSARAPGAGGRRPRARCDYSTRNQAITAAMASSAVSGGRGGGGGGAGGAISFSSEARAASTRSRSTLAAAPRRRSARPLLPTVVGAAPTSRSCAAEGCARRRPRAAPTGVLRIGKKLLVRVQRLHLDPAPEHARAVTAHLEVARQRLHRLEVLQDFGQEEDAQRRRAGLRLGRRHTAVQKSASAPSSVVARDSRSAHGRGDAPGGTLSSIHALNEFAAADSSHARGVERRENCTRGRRRLAVR